MPTQTTDRNLLFGVLALQADFLDAAQFAEACSAWAGRKGTPLADLLVERGLLTAEQRGLVDLLLRQKLNKQGGDAHASLAAVATSTSASSQAGVTQWRCPCQPRRRGHARGAQRPGERRRR